jgi:hypothetical protein
MDFRRRRDCAQHLVHRMCEEHAIERLMSFNFVGIVDEVEGSLSFKARNADPRTQPFYSRILYTWYVTHGDYRNGELATFPVPYLVLVHLSPQRPLRCTNAPESLQS